MRDADRLFAGREDDLLARLRRISGRYRLARGAIGIGDDAAVLPGRPVRVVTVDALVEGQHFGFDLLGPEDLAVRALEANLSDIAAMGARPEAAVVAMAWPASPRYRRLGGRVLAALLAAGAGRGTPLVGGDTVRAAEGAATLSITVVGIPWPGGPVLRSGGRAGDIIAVTGPLGASATGLQLLRRKTRPRDAAGRRLADAAVAAFRTPRARLELARPLARWARALMDLSDGLGLDLPRLAEACRCGFEIHAEAVPVHPATARFASGPGGALARALGGGEDFELLAAIRPHDWKRAAAAVRRAGGDLFALGRLLPRRSGMWLVRSNKRKSEWPRTGWDPFDPGPRFSMAGSMPRPIDAGRRRTVGKGGSPRPGP